MVSFWSSSTWDSSSSGRNPLIPPPLAPRATQEDSILANPEILAVTMTAAGTGMYYTLPIQVGGKSFSVQLDTGSSDLWLASSTCSDPSCKGVSLYNPLGGTTATDANAGFQIQYVVGSISGEIYWDELKVGGRTIPRQALAAADQVANEDMSGGLFSGVMGLALPGNSIIANSIPTPWNLGPLSNLEILPPAIPATSSRRRRFPFSSNPSPPPLLASRATAIDPTAADSGIPFISLALGRPSDPRIASQLGLLSHLPLVCDTNCVANLTYSKVVESPLQEPLFWRVAVQAIDVVDGTTGETVHLPIGSSRMPGQALPVGLLDSGAMGIYFSNRDLVNAIYGSQGIGPASDGFYYLPCTTAIQMAITIGNVRVPVHPLDISDFMASDSTHKQCMGSIQYISPPSIDGRGDFVFGSSFMRNAYTVLSGPKYTAGGKWTTPSLALLPLTATNSSAQEFYRVRTLNQAIIPSTSTNPSSPGASGLPVTSATDITAPVSKTSFGTGPIVGVAIGGLLLLAVGVFLSRYLCLKRRYKKNGGNGGDGREKGAGGGAMGGGHDPFGASGIYAHVPAPPSSPGSSITGATRSEQEKIKDAYRARTDRGSTGSSTLRSFSESDDEGKGGRGGDRPRKSSVASDKFTGGSNRKGTHSILGEGYDELDYENGIMGTDAPTRKLDDDDDEDFQSLAMPSPRPDSLSYVDGYAAVPVKAWRIQENGEPSPSKRPAKNTRSPSESSLSAADSLLLARREARRSRSESPSAVAAINRTSSASSTSTVSSSTLHLGSLPPSSAPHHFYPPKQSSSSSSFSSSPSPQSTPTNLPTPSPSHRPSLFVFSTNLTPSTIIESPFTSPAQGDPNSNTPSLPFDDPSSSSVLKGLPPLPKSSSSTSNVVVPRGPNHQRRASIESTDSNEPVLSRRSVESEGLTESPVHSPGLEQRGALLEGT